MNFNSFLAKLAGIKKKKSLNKKVLLTAYRGVSIALKILVLKVIALTLAFAIPLIIILSVILLITLTYLQIQYTSGWVLEYQNSTTQNYPSGYSFSVFSTPGEWQSFNPTLALPHWIPMTGVVTQGTCSNFYWAARGRVGYPSSWANVAFEDNCRTYFKASPLFRDFAQRYAGGNWNAVWAHWGVDIAGPVGVKVYSMSYGKVVKVSTSTSNVGWGSYVDVYSVYEWTEYVTRYAHLSKVSVQLWEIYAGQEVGENGSTWNSTGPHLHLAICKWTSNFDSCYTGNKDVQMEEPMSYMLNYVVNGQDNPIYIPTELIGKTIYTGVGNPGLTLPYVSVNYSSALGGLEKVTDQSRDQIYYEVGTQENVHPLVLKGLHFRERGLGLTNPTPRSDAGYSGHNEWVYWMYNDFTALTPYCNRSLENFGWFGDTLTIQEFRNQTICAAKVIKSKFWSNANLLTFDNFTVDSQSDKESFCNGLRWYNAGPFYCWNNLYPTHSNNSTYVNMPVYAAWRLLWYHRQDWFLKFVLDNKESFEYSLSLYSN